MGEVRSDDYEHGYAAGVRDCTAWTGEAFGRLQAMAARVEAQAKALNDACRAEVEVAQKRWAEHGDLRQPWPDTPAAPVETSRARRSRRLKPHADPGPTLNLDAVAPPAAEGSHYSDEQQMRRAAGTAWRA